MKMQTQARWSLAEDPYSIFCFVFPFTFFFFFFFLLNVCVSLLFPQTWVLTFSFPGRLLPPVPVWQSSLGTRLNYNTRTFSKLHRWHIKLPTNMERGQRVVFERFLLTWVFRVGTTVTSPSPVIVISIQVKLFFFRCHCQYFLKFVKYIACHKYQSGLLMRVVIMSFLLWL